MKLTAIRLLKNCGKTVEKPYQPTWLLGDGFSSEAVGFGGISSSFNDGKGRRVETAGFLGFNSEGLNPPSSAFDEGVCGVAKLISILLWAGNATFSKRNSL